MEQSIRDPEIPYVGALGGRFTPGKTIRIQGAVPGIAYKFDINLQCGPQTVPRDDIALQISVRILDGFIAINTLQAGVWGEEFQSFTQPIKRANHFEVTIMCDFNKYKIAINGQPFQDFPQRMHYDCITHLTIDGDVTINEILYGSFETFARAIPEIVPSREPYNDFEIINPDRSTGVDSSQPPSYNDVMQNYPTNGQPYPVKGSPRSPYPSGIPVAPYPTEIPAAPYPIGIPTSAPYPTGIPAHPYPTPSSSHHAPSAPNMTLPLITPVPLNAASSNFRPVQKSNTKKYCGYFWSIVLGIIIIIVVVVIKVKKQRTSSKYVATNTNNYANSYDSDYSHKYNWR